VNWINILSRIDKIGFQQVVSIDVIQQAQQGDSKSFSIIYKTYFSACYALAYRMSGNKTMAQDITQESFIKVMRSIQNYQFQGSFAGWLKQIAVRTTIDQLNKDKKVQFVSEPEFESMPTNDLFDINWLEYCLDVDCLLEELPTTSRTVLILHEVEGYSHQEIAHLYNKSESFSKVTLSRAYARLKKLIMIRENKNAS